MAIKLSETYLKLYAAKKTPYADISEVDMIQHHSILALSSKIKLVNLQEQHTVAVNSRIIVKDMAGIKQAVLGGAGVGVLPDFFCSDSTSRQNLKQVCPDWNAGKVTIYALYPRTSTLTAKNRIFIDFLKNNFNQIPKKIPPFK